MLINCCKIAFVDLWCLCCLLTHVFASLAPKYLPPAPFLRNLHSFKRRNDFLYQLPWFAALSDPFTKPILARSSIAPFITKPALFGTSVQLSNSDPDYHPVPVRNFDGVIGVIDEATPFENFFRRHMAAEQMVPVLTMSKLDKPVIVHHYPSKYFNNEPEPKVNLYNSQYGDSDLYASLYDHSNSMAPTTEMPLSLYHEPILLSPEYSANITQPFSENERVMNSFGHGWQESSMKYSSIPWYPMVSANQSTVPNDLSWIADPTVASFVPSTPMTNPLLYNLYDDFSNSFQMSSPQTFVQNTKANIPGFQGDNDISASTNDNQNNTNTIYIVDLNKKKSNVKKIKMNEYVKSKMHKEKQSTSLFGFGKKKKQRGPSPKKIPVSTMPVGQLLDIALKDSEMASVVKKIIKHNMDLDVAPSHRNNTHNTTNEMRNLIAPTLESHKTSMGTPDNSLMRLVQVSAVLNVNTNSQKPKAFYPRPGIVIDEKKESEVNLTRPTLKLAENSTASSQSVNRRNFIVANSKQPKWPLSFDAWSKTDSLMKPIKSKLSGKKSKQNMDTWKTIQAKDVGFPATKQANLQQNRFCENRKHGYYANVEDECKVSQFKQNKLWKKSI